MVRVSKKIKRRTPSGRSVVRRGKKRPEVAKCAKCGAKLHGMPRRKPSELKKMPKSKRVPNRPYGGNLCSGCMRELFKNRFKEKLSIK
jgi:large subunit ribosomal protein L34e